jgi:hypothetical protein
MAGPAYPLNEGEHDGAPQLQLVAAAAGVLAEHGYPPVEHGADAARLERALHDFLYADRMGGGCQ